VEARLLAQVETILPLVIGNLDRMRDEAVNGVSSSRLEAISESLMSDRPVAGLPCKI